MLKLAWFCIRTNTEAETRAIFYALRYHRRNDIKKGDSRIRFIDINKDNKTTWKVSREQAGDI